MGFCVNPPQMVPLLRHFGPRICGGKWLTYWLGSWARRGSTWRLARSLPGKRIQRTLPGIEFFKN
jgi:hypothetical protein